MTHPTPPAAERVTFSIESHYAKQPDGYVYYYWRIVGSDSWNVQKTAMTRVPTVEMMTGVRDKIVAEEKNRVRRLFKEEGK